MGNAKYGTRVLTGQKVSSFGRSSNLARVEITTPGSPDILRRTPGDGYSYLVFKATGTFNVTEGAQYVDVLLVGGGGGSGNSGAYPLVAYGGGGGGGVVQQAIYLQPGAYTVTVGAGGTVGGAGGSSSISNPVGFVTQVALGGGTSFVAGVPAPNGGSGGGASYGPAGTYVPATPFTVGQGNPGGGNISPIDLHAGGAGGGGAGSAGSPTQPSTTHPGSPSSYLGRGGNGGSGTPSAYVYPTFSSDFPANPSGVFGGGGGGGSNLWQLSIPALYGPIFVGYRYPNPATSTTTWLGGTAGTGGSGGGGTGAFATNPGTLYPSYGPTYATYVLGPTTPATNGAANTGGGGGGGAPWGGGGTGGSGIVIVRQAL